MGILYNNFHKIINTLSKIFKIRYICCKKKKLLCSNCEDNNVYDKPVSAMTWNIQGLFYFLNPYKQKNIIKRLQENENDIICLQEVFEDSLKQEIIQKLYYKYPYYLLGNTDKKCIFGEDSGLLILSKYKIKFVKEILLSNNILPDILANKSILYFSVGNLNFATCHLQSSNMFFSEDISGNQIKILLQESPFKQYFILGDLNNNDAYIHTNCVKNNYETTWNNEILDYIFTINYKHIDINVEADKTNIQDVTDHYPLSCTIKYNIL